MNRIARNKLCLGNRHELTAKNKVAATVAQSVPVLRYRFGVLHWWFKNIIDTKLERYKDTTNV
jgi:hypothetical protein